MTQKKLPTWKVILRIIQFSPWLWIGNLLAMFVLIGAFMVPGILVREYFNLLTGDGPNAIGLWAILVLLVASEVGGVSGIYGLALTNVPFFMNTLTLLRRNMLWSNCESSVGGIRDTTGPVLVR